MKQLCLFDDEISNVGEWRKAPGRVICHIMRSAYIGKEILVDKSTHSRQWYRVGILEDYFFNVRENCFRCIVYTGEKQRELIDMRHGVEIFETRMHA